MLTWPFSAFFIHNSLHLWRRLFSINRTSLLSTDKPWTKVGKALPTNKEICNIKDVKKPSFQSKLLCKREMTHDCCLFSLEIPSNVFMQVAIGRHVYVSLQGQPELMRPYTPIPESFAAQNEVKKQSWLR